MPGETVDNKKIVLTNRMAVVILLAFGSAIFSATKFYDQTQYQALVAQQNADKIEAVKEAQKLAEENLRQQIELVRAYAKELVEQEVGGLRKDWERKNEENKANEERQDRQIEKIKDR